MGKLLIINSEFTGGGAANVARMIYEEINSTSDYNYSADFLCRNKRDNDNKSVYDFGITKKEIYLNGFMTRVFGMDSTFSLTWRRKFNQHFLEKYDVIHLHNIHGYYFDIKTLDLLKDKKVIWTFHDMWPITGHCSHSLDCERWISECFHCPHKNIYPKIFLDTSKHMHRLKKKLFKNIKNLTIVVPSEWLLRKVEKSFLKDKRLALVNNGVNQEFFYPRTVNKLREKYEIEKKKKIILFVAEDTNNKLKGFKYLIDAINRLENYHNLILVTVGKNINLDNVWNKKVNIIQLGYIKDNEKLAQVYSDSDIFITPSLAENYPCTIQEAMSCGTPCIGFNVGGIPELIIDNKTGYVINDISSKEISKKIDYVISNDSVIKYLKNQTIMYSKNFSKEKMMSKYIDLYN